MHPLILALLSLALGFLFGFLYRYLLKRFAKGTVRGVSKNINKTGRLMRFGIALGLIAWAVMTTMSPVLLFFAGFTLFEAIFSWCGFFAAIGKSECPIE